MGRAVKKLTSLLIFYMNTAYFTICARNYLAHARVLKDSLRRTAPYTPFYIFLSDLPLDEAIDADIVELDELELKHETDMTFRYDVMEFATAIKPYCFLHLMNKKEYKNVIYLDPDTEAHSSLDVVLSALEDGAGACLTPHLEKPLPNDGQRPSQKEIADSGFFNLGFAAFNNRPDVLAFLEWWADKCSTDCIVDLPNGLFVDQKFVENINDFIPDVFIVKDMTYNVAYWNLPHRDIQQKNDGAYLLNGNALTFFHYSGFNWKSPNKLSKYNSRKELDSRPALRSLMDHYRHALIRNGADRYREIPYGFNCLPDSTPIPKAWRRFYRQQISLGAAIEPYTDMSTRINRPAFEEHPEITIFMKMVWDMRPDLQSSFDLSKPVGRSKFVRWFILHAETEGWARAQDIPTASNFAKKAQAWIYRTFRKYRTS